MGRFWNRTVWVGVKFLTDLVWIPIIFVGAYWIKFRSYTLWPVLLGQPYADLYPHARLEFYMGEIGLVMVLWVSAFYLGGLYRTFDGWFSGVDEFVRVVKCVSIGTVWLMALTFIYRGFPGSRYVILYAWALGIVVLMVSRLGVNAVRRGLSKRGVGVQSVAVVGNGTFGQAVVERLKVAWSGGMRYWGTVAFEPASAVQVNIQDVYREAGDFPTLLTAVSAGQLQGVFVTSAVPEALFSELLRRCLAQSVPLWVTPELGTGVPGFFGAVKCQGFSFLTPRFGPQGWEGRWVKRGMDIAGSLAALVVLAPVFAGVAMVIKARSPGGSVFYGQERVGERGAPFIMWKFRTMAPDAERESGPVLVDDQSESRFIPGGRFLRRTSLDELPQFWNVLKGEMSLVGPRPERPFFVAWYASEIPYYGYRHFVRGGITGWAQVNGRGILNKQPVYKLAYDFEYMREWSFVWDLKILLETVGMVLSGRQAF